MQKDGKRKAIDTFSDRVNQVRPGANVVEPEICKEPGVMSFSQEKR